tara:strand:- start:578 stop:1075 length:498 start_codon:yes stop_codon:yes gene_type:complete
MGSTFSFDVVSDFDRQELVNALDQVKRELVQRYDLKDSNTQINLEDKGIIIDTTSDLTLESVKDIVLQKATKRNLSLKIFDFQLPESSSGNRVKQLIILKRGLSKEDAKKLGKVIRERMKKINVSIQGDSLRITGKSKDELQHAIKILKDLESDLDFPLQYENYR